MHELPAPFHTCEHTSQSGACRAAVRTICVFLILSPLTQIGRFTLFLQPQMLPFCPNWVPCRRGVSLHSGISPLLQLPLPGVQVPSHFLSSSFFLLFFHPTQLCRDLYSPFQCPRSFASFQLVFCENCCIYRCIPDASMERDEFHVHLLLCHLESPLHVCFTHHCELGVYLTQCLVRGWSEKKIA